MRRFCVFRHIRADTLVFGPACGSDDRCVGDIADGLGAQDRLYLSGFGGALGYGFCIFFPVKRIRLGIKK
jgi:hypothetical protein